MGYNIEKQNRLAKALDTLHDYVVKGNLDKLRDIFASAFKSMSGKLWVLKKVIEFDSKQGNKYYDLFEESCSIEEMKKFLELKVQQSPVLNYSDLVFDNIRSASTMVTLYDIFVNIRVVEKQYRDSPIEIVPIEVVGKDSDSDTSITVKEFKSPN